MRIRSRVCLGIRGNMPKTILKHAAKTAFTLVAFAVIFTALMASVEQITKAPIAKSEAAARAALFQQVITEDKYDNAVLKDTVTIAPSAMLGNKEPTIANIARMGGKPIAVILEAITNEGYNGTIKLLVAINQDGSLSGVRVVTHKETPGLGDYIDIAKAKWIKLFDGESLQKTNSANWKVTKDGGAFDYMAGATITPRAVVQAVHKALQYYEENKMKLLAPKIDPKESLKENMLKPKVEPKVVDESI